jgi:glutamate dehydrogenase
MTDKKSPPQDPQAHKEKLLDFVVEKVKSSTPPELQQSAVNFARNYYANVSLEDLLEVSPDILITSVLEMWTFALQRLPNQAMIRIHSEKIESKGYSLSQMIVEIVNDDMPFIVDSVTGAINSLGYSIHLVIHPVMRIERDAAHRITRVFPSSEKGEEGHYESIVHCKILGSFSPEDIAALQAEIERALQDTRAAVEDWTSMRQQFELAIEELQKNPPSVPKDELEETIDFLEWIEAHHFTFLGFCKYALDSDPTTAKLALLPQKGLGILRDPARQEISHMFAGAELSPENRNYIMDQAPLLITKTTEISLVHRRDPMDSITIKHFDQNGKIIGVYQLVGLFTSVAYNKSVWDIPLLRRKVSHIVKRSGFSEEWHDGKALVHILESFPRDELFQASEDWLFKTCMAVLQLQNRQRLTLFIRVDRFERFFSCLVYIPRERYDSALEQRISGILERELQGKITNKKIRFGELAFARMYLNLKILHKEALKYDLKKIEEELLESSLTWRDHLHQTLLNHFGDEKGLQLFEKYGKGFSKGYQERFSPEEASSDIQEMERSCEDYCLRTSVNYKSKDKDHVRFKIYSLEGAISLSQVLPVLENMNFKVVSEIPFQITLPDNQSISLHSFELYAQDGEHVDLEHVRTYFLEGFDRIWHEEVENDGFNRLIIRASLSWQECELIRAYAKYLRQLQVTFSQPYMEETLAKYPLICRAMIQLFTCKFDPNSKEDRERAQEEILNNIKSLLENVAVLDEDRILNQFVNAIYSTIRTNYYQLQDGNKKPYISFKIDCKSIDEMPLPRPKYEIFVYSPRVEAIHLRGGDVARGGIRWSDRREDFRTEVLGLMKAQTVKNAVIVPVGSKGGFIVKRPPLQAALIDEVVFCYETMMCGLLDLTDNIKDGKVVPALDVVRWDGDDPYLVVAADKGTATFSDFANKIAKEYDFWLGDAFASGGSSGYDHKKMGITARGAWESVKRHFREMGIDANTAELTVVGIGDMAGDVFGNGMLLSPHLKLMGAFNHQHIFIDPSPDPATSFQERKRLFDLPQSSWTDYNPSLISRGGGVFERRAKTVKITPEMKAVFEIKEDQLTPADLIRYILKAPVDLIWFGGIGTFIKASSEQNNDVGDRLNDALRIDGIEVRASVIAEGANLGVTQLGRIEYAKNGGRINTDAIDNSAGVDCSDHEVNLKILLGQVIKEHKLDLDKRNQLLKSMTDEVARLVLQDNFWQNQVLSIVESRGASVLDEQARFIRELESEGLLNRALEGIPDEKELARRIMDKQSLTRPELAVLLAYAKLFLKHQLLQSELPDMRVLQSRLLSYFPENLQQSYQAEILQHPLRREITATLFTNSLINRMGITFVYEMKRQLSVKALDVAKAYFIVRDLLDLISLWHDLENQNNLEIDFQTQLMLIIYENVKRMTEWFIRFDQEHRDVEESITFFKPDLLRLREEFPSFFTTTQRETYEENYNNYQQLGLPDALAKRLLSLSFLVSAPDMILLSKELKMDIQAVAKIYFRVGQQFGFDWLRKTAFSLAGETQWSQLAANALVDDFYVHQRTIVKKVLTSGKSLKQLLEKNHDAITKSLNSSLLESLLADAMNSNIVDFAMMTVINRQLQILADDA